MNTGAWDDEGLAALAAHARKLGAKEHVAIDGRQMLYDDAIAWLIRGNVLRGHVYPLCVGAERVVQAHLFAQEANARGITTLAHGSTGAGNDQVRFDVTLRNVSLTGVGGQASHMLQIGERMTVFLPGHEPMMGTVRWAVIALQQAARHFVGNETSLELALTAHVLPVLELDLLTRIQEIEETGR